MLRIDLLPKSFRIARLNKLMLVGLLVVLGLVAAYWLQTGATVNRQIADVEQQIAQVQDAANQYDKTMGELSAKKAELQPIADKVSFVEAADKSGEIYWELYHKLKRYIYAKAQMENFSIKPPNVCSFTVQVTGTTQYARFLLNLLRCPDLTITSFTVLSAGRGVPSVGQPEPGMWPTARGKVGTGGEQPTPGRAAGGGGGVPGMGPVGMGGPRMGMGGMPGAGGPPGGMAPGPMMGGPGGPPGGMGAMGGGPPGMGGMAPGPGGPGGMPGMMGGGGAGAAGATTSPDRQPITIQVAGTLSTMIVTPMPPGAAMGGAGMPGMAGGMPGGMPGMGGAPGGMPGMGGAPGGMPGMGGAPGGMPGAGAPGAGRPGAPGAGAAPGGRAGRAGGGEEEAGGGLGRRRGAEGGEE